MLWSYGKQYVSPADFCFALRYENEKIGNPICYEAGDWERDTTISMYAKWLNTNLSTSLKPEDLRPRNQHVVEKLRSLKDKNLLFSTVKNDKIWFLLFDETGSEPKEIAVFPLNQDSAKMVKKIASSWFGSTPQRRLSDSEREAREREPDSYFAEQPMHDFWIGIGLGYNSWFKNKSKIKNYHIVSSSASTWYFIEDSAPLYSAYIGGSMYDFIGLELEFRRSSHKAKIDESDTIYKEELSHWSFNRYEFLLSLEFMHVFMPIPQIEIEPHISVGLIFSFFTEDIALKDGHVGSYYYNERFKFSNYYSGAVLTLGFRTAFFKNYAIDLRTGIANRRDKSNDAESDDMESNARTIGRSTTDAFVSAGLEYHFRWR